MSLPQISYSVFNLARMAFWELGLSRVGVSSIACTYMSHIAPTAAEPGARLKLVGEEP